ncbi:uncharacterized protein LY89DRAFT_692498 [Mollisia scopiformis]|uniref:Uncharacterized protein n=1 Tax=Mollisia scopiformis TaxID=149040 RepID=A0A132B1V6_MOLSC|nr:uncharacterized protein LY89DRAFT_692498 [Mollisia scopiformis]KUJ06365.1 hypothetical protein LY89DRAFT_692498 [Mollisia scopiformis]
MNAFLQALLSISTISVALASPCNTSDEYDISTAFSSQDDLDQRLAGCTSIDGWLHIAHNYTGSFILNNITNIAGGISTYDGAGNSTGITSIEANGLLSVQELVVFGVPTLENISFPDLVTIDNIGVDLASGGELHFPSLTNCTTIVLSGSISRMDFSSLSSVDDELSISSNDTINTPISLDSIIPSYSPLDVDFPALQNCSQLLLYGNISSVSMPLLESSVPGPFSSGGGIKIATNGNPLNLTFPKLWNTTQIVLSGTIGQFSFPSLLTLDGGVTVNSFYPLNFSLAPLENATILTMQGNVTGLGLGTIQELQQLSISSDEPLDCGIVSDDWARIQKTPLITNPDQQHGKSAWKGFRCDSTRKLPISKATKLKLGLGIGLGLPAFAALLFFVYKEITWHRARAVKPPPYEHELDDRHERGEPLPTYAPRRMSETAVTVSEVSSLSDFDEDDRRHEGGPPSLLEESGENAGYMETRTGHEGHT